MTSASIERHAFLADDGNGRASVWQDLGPFWPLRSPARALDHDRLFLHARAGVYRPLDVYCGPR